MDKQSYLQQIKQAAFVDELGQSETGYRVAEAMGITKEAEGAAIPAARVRASAPANRNQRAAAAFARSPLSKVPVGAAPAAVTRPAAPARPTAAAPARALKPAA